MRTVAFVCWILACVCVLVPLMATVTSHRVYGQDAARASSRHDAVQIEHSADVCSALTPAECCTQMLEIAVFRATGDQVPRSAKAPLRLSCTHPDKRIPENACRLLALGRGVSARDAAQLCVPDKLAKRCADDATCKRCVSDLDRLAFQAPARACYALTYVPPKPTALRRIASH